MMPVKNGVVLYSEEYECHFVADAYALPGWGWLFRFNTMRLPEGMWTADFTVRKIEGMFNERDVHGTMLVKDEYADPSVDFLVIYGEYKELTCG